MPQQPNTHSTITRKALLTALLTGNTSIERVEIKEIELAPGQRAGLHRHPCNVVGYIAHGTIVYELEGQPAKVLHVGDAFHEPEDARVVRFDNASETVPARFIAVYLLGPGESRLIEMLGSD
jgi:quercetin dioxygenase-like cupin family protein